MKIKRVLSVLLVLIMFSANISVMAYRDDVEQSEIKFAFLTNCRPVVGEKIYVRVYDDNLYRDYIPESETHVSYRWYRNDSENNTDGAIIEGANSQYYVISEDDINSCIYCVITGDGDRFTGDTITVASEPVAETAELGGAIIRDDYSGYVGRDCIGYLYRYGSESFELRWPAEEPIDNFIIGEGIADYQWYRNETQSNIGGTPILGADSYKYTPTQDDVGYYIYFTATGTHNYTGMVTSDVVQVYDGMHGGGGVDEWVPNTYIHGAAVENATLFTDPGNRIGCQWYRNDVQENMGGEPILGAKTFKYTVTSEDVGKYLYIEVRGRVSEVTEMVTSDAKKLSSVTIKDEYEPIIGREVGKIETSPDNALAKVQWYRNEVQSNTGGTPILGANYRYYTPVKADVGKYLYCIYTPVAPFEGEPVVSNVTNKVLDVAVIEYDANGGTAEFLFSDEVVIGGTVIVLPDEFDVSRPGYKFKGWSTEKNARVPNFDENTVVSEDITLYAVWERISGGGGPNSGLSTDNTSVAPKPTASPEATNPPKAEPTDVPSGKPIEFNDTVGHWAEEYIKKAAECGLLNGYDDGSFKPENNISIEEFAAIYARTNNLELNAENQEYSFVSSDWSRDYILAVLNRMTDEQAEFVFGNSLDATSLITREQAAYMLTFDKKSDSDIKPNFTDISDNKFKDNIELANQLGYFIGNPDNTFKPRSNITRAEMAAVLDRIK